MKYRIINRSTGIVINTYTGASPEEALDAMARDFGYDDYTHACKVTGENRTELRIICLEHDV